MTTVRKTVLVRNWLRSAALVLAVVLVWACGGATNPGGVRPGILASCTGDEKMKLVIGYGEDGVILWKRPFEQIGSGGFRDLRFDANGAVVSFVGGLVALDGRKGDELWRTNEMATTLQIGGNFLYEVVNGKRAGSVLVARSRSSGREIYRTELPDAQVSDTDPILDFAGLVVIPIWFNEKTIVVDQHGKIWHQFDSRALEFRRIGENRLFMTGHEVALFSDRGDVQWTMSFEPGMSGPGGGTIDLPDKTVVAYVYGNIYDSGVSLLRFDPAEGKFIWGTWCASLNVAHSKYRHRATVTVENQTVRVESIGSYGRFVEILDLASGKRLWRHVGPDELYGNALGG